MERTFDNNNQARWQLKHCDNPWKRNECNGQSEVYRRMLGILNRVTNQSLNILLPQALALPLTEPEHLSCVLSLLLSKAQDEPLFISTYASFCYELLKEIDIKEALKEACWKHFCDSLQYLKEYSYAHNLQYPQFSMEEAYEEILIRKRLSCHLAFVSCLEKKGIVSISMLNAIAETLLSYGDFQSIECLCKLLFYAGAELAVVEEDIIYRSCEALKEQLTKDDLSRRLEFLIKDTLSLKENGWVLPVRARQTPHFYIINVRG